MNQRTVPSGRARLAALALVALVTVGVAGCGDDGEPTSGQVPGAVDGTTFDQQGVDPWLRTAVQYRGMLGERVTVECPPRGLPGQVWGTGVYTDDSSMCAAAVHVGLIGFDDGGDVVIEILPGQPEYIGSIRNGVESITYGAVDGSFSFPDAGETGVDTSIAWERPASFYGDEVGARFTVVCREGGAPDSVWGTGTYTDDSSICTAAVHAGLISVGEAGEVTFELAEGQASYRGSVANGITSLDYGPWEASFTFVA